MLLDGRLQAEGLQLKTQRSLLLINAVGIIVLALMMGFALLQVLAAPVGRDENMYISAAYFTQMETPYRDFAYFQMPYLPVLHAFAYKLPGVHSYLLVSRLLTWLAFCVSLLTVYWFAKVHLKSTLIAICFAALLGFSSLIMLETTNVTNSAPANMLLVLGVVAYVQSLTAHRWKQLTLLLFAGVALGSALSFRLTYAIMLLPTTVSIILSGGSPKIKQIIFHLLGVLVALLPVIVMVILYQDSFVFNNLGYHALNTDWRVLDQDSLGSMSLLAKLWNTSSILNSPSFLMLFVLFAILATLKLRQFRYTSKMRSSFPLLFAAMLIMCAVAAAFYPSPPQPRYYTMVVVSMILAAILLYRCLEADNRQFARLTVIVVAFVTSFHTMVKDTRTLLPEVIGNQSIDDIVRALPDRWTHNRLQDVASELRDVIPQAEVPVMSLTPIYVLEAGLPIFTEFATGVFGYRIGEYMPDEEQQQYHVVPRTALSTFLDANNHAGVLVGEESAYFEQQVIDYVNDRGYFAHQLSNGMTLYTHDK